MQKRKFDEIVSYCNKKVSEMEIETKYKMELLGMVTALGYAHEKETHEERTEAHACDLISRQAAVELAMKYCPDDDGAVQCDGDIRGLLDELENLPPAQPEHDAEFWRKRAEEYSNICIAMTAEMTKGIKFNSIRIDENGICFGKEQPEQKWIPCSERLPDESYGCLVTVWDTDPITMDEFENILPYFVGWDGEQWNDADGEQCPFEVIAWMPLPEPYREEGTE